MGYRFDTVIICYFTALPFLVLTLNQVFKNNVVAQFVRWFYFLSFLIIFYIASADIPFFNHFFTRLNVSSLMWMDQGSFMIGMILQELSFIVYILAFLIASFVFYRMLKQFTRNYLSELKRDAQQPFYVPVIVFVICGGLIFLGIRGRVAAKSPIRVGTAYFSSDPFYNQLGLNPVFTFIESYLQSQELENQKLSLMENELAIKKVQEYLGFNGEDDRPLARSVKGSGTHRPNIVIVIMESMSAHKMKRYGNEDNITPHLDSLCGNSMVFDQVYTAGIHTFNGVYSTIFSMPAVMHQHPMNKVVLAKHHGIASILKVYDYNTIYFTTHDSQFDNVGGFLSNNDFDQIISESDYPREMIKSTLGAPDHMMFDFSAGYINQLQENENPFLAVYMTASDHKPFVIPEDIPFKAKQEEEAKQIVEYADWSVNHLLDVAKKDGWYDNTVFVFVADHGGTMNPVYDMPLSYHHTPAIFHGPEFIEPGVSNTLGGQIDVVPTLLGLLDYSYTNNSLGVDLTKHKRPYIYFSADNKIGCINNNYFYVERDNGVHSLYHYKTKDKTDYIKDHPQLVDSMRNYAHAAIQATQWIVDNMKADYSPSN